MSEEKTHTRPLTETFHMTEHFSLMSQHKRLLLKISSHSTWSDGSCFGRLNLLHLILRRTCYILETCIGLDAHRPYSRGCLSNTYACTTSCSEIEGVGTSHGPSNVRSSVCAGMPVVHLEFELAIRKRDPTTPPISDHTILNLIICIGSLPIQIIEVG